MELSARTINDRLPPLRSKNLSRYQYENEASKSEIRYLRARPLRKELRAPEKTKPTHAVYAGFNPFTPKLKKYILPTF